MHVVDWLTRGGRSTWFQVDVERKGKEDKDRPSWAGPMGVPRDRYPGRVQGFPATQGLRRKKPLPLPDGNVGLEQPQTYPGLGLPFSWRRPSVAGQKTNSKERSKAANSWKHKACPLAQDWKRASRPGGSDGLGSGPVEHHAGAARGALRRWPWRRRDHVLGPDATGQALLRRRRPQERGRIFSGSVAEPSVSESRGHLICFPKLSLFFSIALLPVAEPRSCRGAGPPRPWAPLRLRPQPPQVALPPSSVAPSSSSALWGQAQGGPRGPRSWPQAVFPPLVWDEQKN